jgi:recombination associated protein RdgC
MLNLFKNIAMYQITQPGGLYIAKLVEEIEESVFKPCGPSQALSVGFVPVFEDGPLLYEQTNWTAFRVKIQTKTIPAAGLNDLLDEKVSKVEKDEGRKIYRKERLALKDDIVAEKLPGIIPVSESIMAYIDLRTNFFFVDAVSDTKADHVSNLVRDTIGSFPIMRPEVTNSPPVTMTAWLTNRDCGFFTPGHDCELRDATEDGAVIRVTGDDLYSDAVESAISEGKTVHALALNLADVGSFTLNSTLAVKKFKLYTKEDEIDETDVSGRFDTEMFLFVEGINQLAPLIGNSFGGWFEQKQLDV